HGGGARRVGDQHHGATAGAKARQRVAGRKRRGDAVVHHAPDVGQNDVVARRERRKTVDEGGRGHALGLRRAQGRRQGRTLAPRASWAGEDPPREVTGGAPPGAAAAAGGGTSLASRITTSLRSPIPCITSGRTGRGGENRKPWPNFTS